MHTALLRTAAVTALTLATGLGGVATAEDMGHGRTTRPVKVKIGASGIQAPPTAHAGLVSFHVTTDDSDGRFVQAFRPHRGVTLKKVLADLAKAVSETPAAAQGISAVRDEADLFGGASVTPAVSETFTTPITAGRVYLLDFSAFLKDQQHPVLRRLELRGEGSGDLAGFPDSIVIEKGTKAGPRFEVKGLRKAKDSILVHNAADQIHKMEIQPVAPGTTDAQLQAIFDGTEVGPLPFTGPAFGLGEISPGRTALLETHHLPRGTYVLICFVPDDETGAPHAFEGQHKVVVLQ
jgi:hypothetical protein